MFCNGSVSNDPSLGSGEEGDLIMGEFVFDIHSGQAGGPLLNAAPKRIIVTRYPA